MKYVWTWNSPPQEPPQQSYCVSASSRLTPTTCERWYEKKEGGNLRAKKRDKEGFEAKEGKKGGDLMTTTAAELRETPIWQLTSTFPAKAFFSSIWYVHVFMCQSYLNLNVKSVMEIIYIWKFQRSRRKKPVGLSRGPPRWTIWDYLHFQGPPQWTGRPRWSGEQCLSVGRPAASALCTWSQKAWSTVWYHLVGIPTTALPYQWKSKTQFSFNRTGNPHL